MGRWPGDNYGDGDNFIKKQSNLRQYHRTLNYKDSLNSDLWFRMAFGLHLGISLLHCLFHSLLVKMAVADTLKTEVNWDFRNWVYSSFSPYPTSQLPSPSHTTQKTFIPFSNFSCWLLEPLFFVSRIPQEWGASAPINASNIPGKAKVLLLILFLFLKLPCIFLVLEQFT